MKRLFSLSLLLGLIASTELVVSAQDIPHGPPVGPPPGGMQQRFQVPSFAELDKNKDKKLSKDEVSQFPPQMIERLDENKDGFIDEEEWNRMRGRMGGPGGGMGERLIRFMDSNTDSKVSREEYARVVQLFDALDKDHNGELSQEELNGFFQAMTEVQAQPTGGVDINNLFRNMDKNKDSKLTADELTNEKLFKSLDLNKDGSVNREEAEQALKQMNERARQQKQTPPAPQ